MGTVEIRDLFCNLTPDEIEQRKTMLPELVHTKLDLQEEAKASAAAIKQRIKDNDSKIVSVKDAIRSKREMRPVRCTWHERAIQRELIREDTGEVIEVKLLNDYELRARQQLPLPEVDRPTPATTAAEALPKPTGQEKAKKPKGGKDKEATATVTADEPSDPVPWTNKGEPVHRKAKADGPLPCPVIPTKGHPQRALRGWVYARLCQAGELTAVQLCAEAKEVHPEYVHGTLALLEACELVGPWGKDQLAAIEDESGRGVDARVQDVVCSVLADEALDAKTLASAMKVPIAVILDVLDELRAEKRITKRGDLWRQAERVEGAAQ